MSRRQLATTVVAVLLAMLVGLLVTFWDYDVEETKRVMLATTHHCPSDTTERIERAGEVGWLRLCMKGQTRHGPFTYWKKQHKYAEGAYVDGRHTGKVKYFDETGKVVRIEDPK